MGPETSGIRFLKFQILLESDLISKNFRSGFFPDPQHCLNQLPLEPVVSLEVEKEVIQLLLTATGTEVLATGVQQYTHQT